MSGFITELTKAGGINSTSLWETIGEAVPFIVIVFGVSFGLYILRRALRGAQKGKARI